MPERAQRARRRWGLGCFLLAGLAGCGARTELFGAFPDEPIEDAGSGTDAAGSRDAGSSFDAIAQFDATAIRDAGGAFDAGRDANVIDAAIVDAGVNAAPIVCPFTTETVIATLGNVEADQIELDDSYVYFHDNNGVSRVAKSGGSVTVLTSAKPPEWPDLFAFALDDSTVTWLQILNGQMKTDLRSAPKQGGTTSTIATLPNYYYAEIDGPPGSSYVWGNGTPNSPLESVAANGAVTQIGTALPAFASSVAYDRGDLFALSQDGVFLWDGATWGNIAPPPARYPNLMRFDETSIYVLSQNFDASFVVSSVPRTGGTFTDLLEVPNSYQGGFAIDGDHVWVIERVGQEPGPRSTLFRMNKDGSELTTITTTDDNQIVGIAVDDQCIYWTETTGTGKIPSRVIAAPK